MLQSLSKLWDGVKSWFKYSETILLARLEVITGFLIAAVEGMDWSALMNLDFSNSIANKQLLAVGGIVVVKGFVSEYARRRNANL